jgi:putative ABC transport system permease protein
VEPLLYRVSDDAMPPPSLFVRLAVQQLRHRPARLALLALAVAVGGGTVFSAAVLRRALHASMGTSLDRMGADLMVVPRQTTVHLSSALLTVEPTPHTLDAGTVAEVARLPGVEVAAPQRHFALPGAGGAHGDGDLIAFDPERDFTVLPWLQGKLDRPLRRGDVIVGGRRPEEVGGSVSLFGQTYPVYGKLALTGVGPFERSLFVTFDTAADVSEAAKLTTGRDVLNDDPGRASAVLVRLRAGATPEQFRFAAAGLTDAQVIAGNGLSTTVRQGMALVLGGAVVFTALTLLATALMVGAVYTGLLSERRRELGLLLAVGMRPGQLLRLILGEAALTAGLGGACGVILGAAGILLFQRSLGYYFERYQVPFALPPLAELAVTGAVSVALCCGVGVLGALLPAWRAGRREPYDLVRGEGV